MVVITGEGGLEEDSAALVMFCFLPQVYSFCDNSRFVLFPFL